MGSCFGVYRYGLGLSLGFSGQNFVLSWNLRSVRSGLPGIPSWAHRPKLPVWARKLRLRVARTVSITDSESTPIFGSYRVLLNMFGYLWAEIQAPTRILRFGRGGSVGNSGRSLYFGPQIPEYIQNTPYGPEFCVDSESAVRTVQATRNRDLRAQTGNFGRRAQLGIPGSPDQTDLKFELNIKFRPRTPKLGPRSVICANLWRNSVFFFELPGLA